MATIIHRGQKSTSVLNGGIRIEDGNNRLVIYKGNIELATVDETGFTFTNSSGTIKLGAYLDGSDYLGLLFTDNTGRRVQLNGQAPDDGRNGSWIAKDGEDVITNLGG